MKYLITLITLFSILLASSIWADLYWEKTFGLPEVIEDVANSIDQTNDGGFILAGFTNDHGGSQYNDLADLWVIKTDALGNMEWDLIYAGYEEGPWIKIWDEAHAVRQTSDGGYIVVGNQLTSSSFNDSQVLALKLDPNGNPIWIKTYGSLGLFGSTDIGYDVIESDNGCFIITGYTDEYGVLVDNPPFLLLLKIDPYGNELWAYSFGGSETNVTINAGYAIEKTVDDCYIVIGSTNGHAIGEGDVWLLKFDENGNKLWEHSFGDPGASDVGWDVQQTTDNGFIIAGRTWPYEITENFYALLIKTDEEGNEEWTRTFGEYDCEIGCGVHGMAVQQSPDGGYAIFGRSGCFSGGYEDDGLIIKTNSEGFEDWHYVFGKEFSDRIYDGQLTPEGGYIMVGYIKYEYGRGRATDVWLTYYYRDNNHSPNPPTLIAPENDSIVEPGLVTFTWINNGDPDANPVGSWLYVVGPWGQVFSYDMGSQGFTVGEELSFAISLFSEQEWAWTIYIYDPSYSSDPYYNFQQPFWTFTVSSE